MHSLLLRITLLALLLRPDLTATDIPSIGRSRHPAAHLHLHAHQRDPGSRRQMAECRLLRLVV